MLRKYTTKLSLSNFHMPDQPVKSQGYRKYTRAYFEEIVIKSDLDSRTVSNYRKQFLSDVEDIYTAFQMYCKEDYED